MVEIETTWERYRVFDEDRNPIEAVLWNVIRRRGEPVRILMTMEAFRFQRTLFTITRPNHMRLKEPPEPTPETSPEGTPERTPSEWEERDSDEDIPGAQAPLPQQKPVVGAQELSLQEELLPAEELLEPVDLGPSCSTSRGRRAKAKAKQEDPSITPEEDEPSADAAADLDSEAADRVRLAQAVNERALTRQAAKKATDPSLRSLQDEFTNNTLKAQLKKVTKERDQSRRHEAAARAENTAMREENTAMREKNDAIRQELDIVTVQAASFREENDSVIAEGIRAQNELAEKDEEFTYMNNQNMALQKKSDFTNK